ncbi:MAG: uridine phosphorylase [Spirochaetae bacterium HGW-Spirochaetae-2]|jgi:uridine phosphorylase|nr:MAG: uridine phosphorylase [Spirochaetae bacterium HGW-Spirochaetae-2]
MKPRREMQVAANPIVDNLLPHLKIDIRNTYPEVFLLPGDPERVLWFADHADTFELIAQNREFTTAIAQKDGVHFGVASTGIGSGSTEIAVVELNRVGVGTLIRVGGCGALQPGIPCGSFIINSGAVRMGGSSRWYVRPEFPAIADPFVCTALAEAATAMGESYFMGIGVSTDSYYEGQLRNSMELRSQDYSSQMEEHIRNRVLNFDMEAETIFTLGYLFGMHTGAILGVHGNRATDTWLVDFKETQEKCIDIAVQAIKRLHQ